MEFILLSIIVLQVGYSIYKDALYAKEREKLRLMIKSKDVVEYASVAEPPEEATPKEEEDPYVAVEEISVEQLIQAKENL